MEHETQTNAGSQNIPLAFSAQQLADRLGVSLRHIRRLDSCGKLPKPVRLGRCCRFPVAELESWLVAGAPDRKTWQAMKVGRT